MLNAFLMLAAATAPIQPRCQPAAQQATAMLHAADKAAARGDQRVANASLDRALSLLGTAYRAPRTIDDTGMHLVLAESRRREGKPKLAAELKRRILLERLELCTMPATPGATRNR